MSMSRLAHPSHHRTWVEIDLGALADNIRYFRRLVGPERMIMPAVKADAYGHGGVEVARAALSGGADRLAVATCLEGQMLREAGIGVPIQILGACLPEEIRLAVKYNLIVSLHEVEIARQIALEAMRVEKTVPVHVKIDTGMGRLGILPEDAAKVAGEIASLPGMRLDGVFMHFADAGDEAYSRYQLQRFETACQALREAGVDGFIRHAANSTATVALPAAWYDLVRPGAGIYGYLDPAWLRPQAQLAPVMSWRSAIIQLKDYPSGSNLGYNRSFTTRRPTRVAVLPVGYADGYRREFSNRAEVLIRGRRAPVVGVVSMDYIMADVTDFGQLDMGTVATLLGSDRGACITPEEMAQWGSTIPYCITSQVGKRVARIYGNNSADG